MAFLPGRTLNELVDDGPVPLEEAVTVVEQIASALDTIHQIPLLNNKNK